MFVYTVDGIRHKSEVPLDEADLEELAGKKPSPQRNAQPEGNYKAEAVREGLSSFLGNAAGVVSVGGNLLALEPDVLKDFSRVRSSVRDPMMQMLGSTGAQPKDSVEKILRTGIETMSDPLNYLLPSGAIINAMKIPAKAAFKSIEGFLAGAGAEAGGTAGEYIDKKVGGQGGIGRVIGALGGGVGGGLSAGAGPRTAKLTTEGIAYLGPKVRNVWRGISGRTPLNEVEKSASRHIENVFVAAAASDPNFLKVLEEAAEAQAKTGVKLPLSSVLSDNKVINAYIEQLAAKDPAFHNQYFSQYENAKKALSAKATSLFGSPEKADKILSGRLKDLDITKAVGRRVSEIGKKVGLISERLRTVDPEEFGRKIIHITDEAERAAINSTRPAYKNAFDLGKAKGVHLKEDAVADIYEYVAGKQANDIFKTFPSIHGKVASKFAPQNVDGAGLVDAAGNLLGAKTSKTFSAASLEDLDSLKREINSQLRKTRTDSEVRLLSELKAKVNSHIDELDPDFVAAYRGADKLYLERVGLPFNEETINMIGRAKFNENVVPLLTRNKSTLSQFLDATGDNGKALAEQAFISDLTNFAVKDGVLDVAKANAWMKNKTGALSLVPEVKARVLAASRNVESLLNQKAALGNSFIKRAESRILKLEGKSAQEIASNMYKSHDFTEKFMRQHGSDPDNLRAVRSFLLDDIIKSNKPVDVLSDRSKSAVFNRVFGPTYADNVKQLAIIAYRITYDPSAVATRLSSIPRTRIEEVIGAPPEMIISRITNPVMSNFYAFTSLLSRFFARKTGEAIDRDMKRILLDPQEAAGLFKALRPKMDKIDYEKMAKAVAEISKNEGLNFMDMLLQDMRSGALRSPRGFDQDQPYIQQPEEEFQ